MVRVSPKYCLLNISAASFLTQLSSSGPVTKLAHQPKPHNMKITYRQSHCRSRPSCSEEPRIVEGGPIHNDPATTPLLSSNVSSLLRRRFFPRCERPLTACGQDCASTIRKANLIIKAFHDLDLVFFHGTPSRGRDELERSRDDYRYTTWLHSGTPKLKLLIHIIDSDPPQRLSDSLRYSRRERWRCEVSSCMRW